MNSQPDPQPSDSAILDVVASIPRGRVSTYGLVAMRAGLPRRARLVGRVLSKLPAGTRVPWHRVLAAGGRIAFPVGSASHKRQREKLIAEGIAVLRGRVDIDRHGWSTPQDDLDRWLWAPGESKTRRGGSKTRRSR
jgi:methylated-DNA-protein-cysteine methyltransferase related protein